MIRERKIKRHVKEARWAADRTAEVLRMMQVIELEAECAQFAGDLGALQALLADAKRLQQVSRGLAIYAGRHADACLDLRGRR